MIDSSLFSALQNVDIDLMVGHDITQVLPYMANLMMSSSFIKRPQLLKLLYPMKKMNGLIQAMSIKGIDQIETKQSLETISFEWCCYIDKLRVVVAEYNRLQESIRLNNIPGSASTPQQPLQSDLFENAIYVDDVSYCLSTILMKSTVYNILEMSETLIHIKFGDLYVVRLVANMPDRCLEVCQALISSGERIDETGNQNEISYRRAKTLRTLCTINPAIAFTIRSLTIQQCKMPSLTVMITIDKLTDVMDRYTQAPGLKLRSELEDTYDGAVAFIAGIFQDCEESTRNWFAQYTKNVQIKRIDHNQFSILSNLRSQLIAYLNVLFDDILSEGQDTTPALSNKIFIRATATLRLYCALRGIATMKLNNEEIEIILRLITYRSKTVNPTVVNYAITGVCTLLVCSGLIGNPKDEKRASDWLKWIIGESNYNDTHYSNHGKCSISELLLLVAIHFFNNQTSQIADLVCATLGMKLQIKISVSKCKTLFVQEVFNDQMVTEHAVRVPVTKNLSNNILEFLPAHCIHQLLESRSFSKHQVSIHEWIYNQICQSMRPIHIIMPKLVEAYVNSVIISTPTPTGSQSACDPIPEDQLIRIFAYQLYLNKQAYNNSDKEPNGEVSVVDMEASQVLLLYYILLYEDLRLKKNPDFSPSERARLTKYSPDFMMEIPVFYLLRRVRNDQDSFGTIFPELIKLVTSQFPQLCSIQQWMCLEHDTTDYTDSLADMSIGDLKPCQKPYNDVKQTLFQQLQIDLEAHPLDLEKLIRDINQILLLDCENIWFFCEPFVNNLHKLVSLNLKQENTDAYTNLIVSCNKLWWRLNNIFPRKLWVMTINALKRPQKYVLDLKTPNYNWDELVLDPLIVLRCDREIFRCPKLLNITLNILNAFLAASRRCLQDHIYEQPRQVDLRCLEELRSGLIHAQTSAAIQILLEYCLPTEDEQECLIRRENGTRLSSDDEYMLSRYDASISIVCEHLHQVFIADTNLAKLVHFQTYPSELLATTSDKIPSMHICLDFIPELLSQPDISKQVFVIELTSYLCEKYAITKSLNVAKLCFNVSFTLLQLLTSERRALFFIPVLPALMRICQVFPILREDAEIILNQIHHISLAHMAATSSRLSLGAAKPFQGLENLSWREARVLMTKLSLNEALYLCIQKSLVQMKMSNPPMTKNNTIAPISNGCMITPVQAATNTTVRESR